MIDSLIHIAVFLIEAIIIVVAVLVIIGGILGLATKNKMKIKGRLIVKPLNKRFNELRDTIHDEILSKKEQKAIAKSEKKSTKHAKKSKELKKILFIVDFNGDLKASGVDHLREEITGILSAAKKTDEVLIRLQSPGGSVIGYGLAASQLQRIRNANIPLTVSVDQVAASGGYMMACVADKILAAPFAFIGSIGVIAQMPNFHRWLQNRNIDFEQITAGEYKRTLTMFGKNTEADREKMQSDIDDIHQLFKQHVGEHRPQLDMNQVATGEYWLATRAKEMNLVDELLTSDDYLMQLKNTHKLLHISMYKKKKLSEKIGGGVKAVVEQTINQVNQQDTMI